MKRINSIDGCNERDHELGFSIEGGTVETYFGREVYEEKRREYTDDESRIDDRTNLDTMDNVFCTECEKMFSKYESKYSRIYQLPFNADIVDNNKLTGAEAALFWYSVIWRISATDQFKVKLKPDFEEKLRRIVFSEKLNSSDIYYALFHCKDYRNNNPTFALFDSVNDVAMLIVDEFMLLLFNGKQATLSDDVLWGMSFKGDASKLNDGNNAEKISLFPINIFKQINDYIILQVIRRIDFRGKFNAWHSKLFGCEMPELIFQEVMAEVSKAKLGDRFTVTNYAKSFKRVIQAHPDIYKVVFFD